MAEVLSQAGYATGFFGKYHLGDTEESYPHNQGFDEAFWALYNQMTSLYNDIGEGANAIIGMKEHLLPENPYQRRPCARFHSTITNRSDYVTLACKRGVNIG